MAQIVCLFPSKYTKNKITAVSSTKNRGSYAGIRWICKAQGKAMEIDRFDQAILNALAKDARVSIADLAPKIGLSATACARRLKLLEGAGLIKAYQVVIDLKQLGYQLTAFVRITLDTQREEALEDFERSVRLCPSIIRCHLMSGSADYLLILLCRDIVDFENIYRKELSRLPGVLRIESSFAMRDVVDRALPRALFSAQTSTAKRPAKQSKSP